MGRKRRAYSGEKRLQNEPDGDRWWKATFSKVAIAVAASTGGVLLGTYNEALTGAIRPAAISAWEWIEDRLRPMPDGKDIGVAVQFYIPATIDKDRQFEGVSVTLPSARCKGREGASIERTFDDGLRDSYTNAIIKIACRASGRTLVTLTPESGAAQIVYDGIFKDGERVAFPGIPGSYYAGIVSLYLLDTTLPDGPWQPVNKCQINNTCAAEFRKGLEAEGQHVQ